MTVNSRQQSNKVWMLFHNIFSVIKAKSYITVWDGQTTDVNSRSIPNIPYIHVKRNALLNLIVNYDAAYMIVNTKVECKPRRLSVENYEPMIIGSLQIMKILLIFYNDVPCIWVRILNDVQLAIFRPWALLLHLVRPQLLRNHLFWCHRKEYNQGFQETYILYIP